MGKRGHLISFVEGSAPSAAEAEGELRQILSHHLACVRSYLAEVTTAHGGRMTALALKRARVPLPAAAEPTPTYFRYRSGSGDASERLGELLNVLATVHRTADALQYLARSAPGTKVTHCNPTTSNKGHDIEGQGQQRVVVEVSDVAGQGNANNKMKKDLETLLDEVRKHDNQGGPRETRPRLLLAVSPSSAAWLTRSNDRKSGVVRGLGVEECTEVDTVDRDPSSPTHIIEVTAVAALPEKEPPAKS